MDDLRMSCSSKQSTANMAYEKKSLIIITAVIVNLSFVCPCEAVSGQKLERSPVETDQLSSIKLYQSKNDTQTEDKKFIGGVEPGAFYAGIVLLVLLLMCFVLCSCLCGSRTTTDTVNEVPSEKDDNIQKTSEGNLSEVKVNLDEGKIQHTYSCVDNEGFATRADTREEQNDSPNEITIELTEVRVESEETKETELEESCVENAGFKDEVQL